jgi:hypothetical protein
MDDKDNNNDMMMMMMVIMIHKSALTRYNKRLSVKLAPSSECRKSLLKVLTSIFRMNSSGKMTVRAPSSTATYIKSNFKFMGHYS